jgi:hypothetical protein
MNIPDNININWGERHKELEYVKDKYGVNAGIDLLDNEWKKIDFDLSKISMYQHRIEKLYDWMKCIDDAMKTTNLENLSYCIHAMTTGNFLPWHSDAYTYYAKVNNIKDIDQIVRIIVFLDDSVPGHILLVGDKPYTNYKKGDVAYWTGDTPHLAGNFSPVTRYTMQITGTIKNKEIT